jgi:hypothetical protein
MKFRKKPVVIEAFQFTQQIVDDVLNGKLEPPGGDLHVFIDRNENVHDPRMVIHTLEGDMTARLGDWIITGVNGERYPCKPDIFMQTYEPVQEAT